MIETISNTEIHLFYPILFVFIIIMTFIIARAFKNKLDNTKDIYFKDKDVEITSEAFKKIGEVKNGSSNEIILNLQNVENNKEIQKNNEIIEELEDRVHFLLEQNASLKADCEILKSKFDSLKNVIGREI